jgi:RNA polymerase sigma-70 factor (ECF subfamily)
MAHPTDEQVLERVKQGEHSAYLILFDRYYSRIERYAARLIRDADAARDAASATFLQAFREMRRNRTEPPRYPAYLFLVCRRKVQRELSRQSSMPISSWRGAKVEESGGANLEEMPLHIILSPERDALLQSALDRLSIEDCEILHLAFEPDLSCSDIRMILRQPSEVAVTAHLNRALRRLGASVLRVGYLVPEPKGKSGDCVKHGART